MRFVPGGGRLVATLADPGAVGLGVVAVALARMAQFWPLVIPMAALFLWDTGTE
jgi:hypothetical protein